MPKNKKDKKLKPIPYRDIGRVETLRQPKSEFVDLFKIIHERAVVRRAAAEVARSHNKPKPPSNRAENNTTHTSTEMNSMSKDKKFKPTSYRDFPSSVDRIPQPKGKFVNPFTAMRKERQAAEREAGSAHSRQQNQIHE